VELAGVIREDADCDVAFCDAEDAFFEDEAVWKELPHLSVCQQPHFLDDFMDDLGLHDAAGRPTNKAMLHVFGQVLDVWRE